MLSDFMLRANAHMIAIVALNEGACFFAFYFFAFLLFALLAALFALQTFCLICFNMLNIHANRIVTC